MPATRRNRASSSQSQPAQPVRRSSRIAASSRASSAAPEENDVAQPTAELFVCVGSTSRPSKITENRKFSPICKTRVPFPPQSTQCDEWTVKYAITRIVYDNDRMYIKRLTPLQKEAVISAFADREKTLKSQLEELQEKNAQHEYDVERLKKERDHEKALRMAKPSLRDAFIYKNIHGKPHPRSREALEAQGPQTEPSKNRKSVDPDTTPTKPAARSSSRPTSSDGSTQTEVQQSSPSANITQQTAPSTPPTESHSVEEEQQEHAHAQTEVQKPKSWFSRIYGAITNPFASPTAAAVAAQSAQAEALRRPLGDLTGSRKRTFTQVQAKADPQRSAVDFTQPPQITSTPKMNMRDTLRSSNTTSKATRTRRLETPFAAAQTPLTTISEHSESADVNASATDETPARPYRSINAMRRLQQERERAARTPLRSSRRTPAPRERNADTRLQRLQEFRTVEVEDEAEDLTVSRPTKRVKIDDLVEIPHNRPGEPTGTFGLWDELSDDEMEVDVDAPVRSNMFEQTQSQVPASPPVNVPVQTATPFATPTPAQPSLAAASAEKENQQAEGIDPLVEDMILRFPSIGACPEHLKALPFDAVAAAKFKYGYETWRATSELIQW